MALPIFDDQPQNLRRKIAVTFSALVFLNLAAWFWATTAFWHQPALIGMAVLAYAFGLRHAFDADHIAAIDNVVRKLMQRRKQPFAAGLFFSLGHSTIVFAGSVAVALLVVMPRRFLPLQEFGASAGTLISATFLLAIGLANMVILHRNLKAWISARRRSQPLEACAHEGPVAGGFFMRVFGTLMNSISKSWHMYPIGLLFGLGFDTATEIGLLGISAAQSLAGNSIWTILVFPTLFTAGMSLMDTADSVFMAKVYGWAFVKPLRKAWYSFTLTATSIVIALFVGLVEAADLLARKFGFNEGLWKTAHQLNGNMSNFGFAIVGLFILSWATSAIAYKAYEANRAS